MKVQSTQFEIRSSMYLVQDRAAKVLGDGVECKLQPGYLGIIRTYMPRLNNKVQLQGPRFTMCAGTQTLV